VQARQVETKTDAYNHIIDKITALKKFFRGFFRMIALFSVCLIKNKQKNFKKGVDSNWNPSIIASVS